MSAPLAPKTVIEQVTVARPLKVGACLMHILAIILLGVTIASSAWMEADDFRQGLWYECTMTPKSMNCTNIVGTAESWVFACQILIVSSLGFFIFGSASLIFALRSVSYRRRFRGYRVAIYVTLIGIVLLLITLVVFPARFMDYAVARHFEQWYFKWAYGLGWISVTIFFSCIVMVLVDKDTEEIFYRERLIQDDDGAPSKGRHDSILYDTAVINENDYDEAPKS